MPNREPRYWSLPYLLTIAVLLLAAGLRAYNRHLWPPGLSHDEAINGVDALRLLHSGVIPFYARDGRPEPLYRLLLSITVGLVGPTTFGLRLASFYIGMLGVAAASRAGRHLAPPLHPRLGRWFGLLAASVLAIIVSHIHLSRVTYRGILIPLALLLFFDAFVTGWRQTHFARVWRHFAAAGVWVSVSMLSYTSGLIALPLALIGVGYQLVTASRRWLRRWCELLIMALAFVITISPLVALLIIQPDLYGRAGEVGQHGGNRSLTEHLSHYMGAFLTTWQGIYEVGDINPQYNVAQTPLLHTLPLYGLLWLGMVASALRLRRLPNALALVMLFGSLAPVALANEIPHGLRIVAALAALPLVLAAAIDPLMWIADRLTGHLQKAWRTVVGSALAAILIGAGVQTAHIYFTYFRQDIRWGTGGAVSAFSWFFETKRQTVAEVIAQSKAGLGEVIYIPLTEAGHPSMRYFTARSHPVVATFATYFPAAEPLSLPAGRFLIPPWIEAPTTFAAFMPDGTLVLLPRFDPEILDRIQASRQVSTDLLYDEYGELAAAAFEFPADGGEIVLQHTIRHPVRVNYGNQINLVGWDAPPALSPDGSWIEVTLYFSRGASRQRDPSIFTQIWTLDAQRVASGDESVWLRWLYPPDQWQPDDIVPFVNRQHVPENLDWGAYHLAVGLHDYRHRYLPVIGADGSAVAEVAVAGTLKVPRTDPISLDGLIPLEVQFGDQISLLGYRLTDESGAELTHTTPDQPILVTLYWQALRQPDTDYTVFLHVTDLAGEMVAQSDTRPEGGRYPTSILSAGEIVTSTHLVQIPPTASGPFTLYTGLYSWPSLERLPAVQDGREVAESRVQVAILP